VRRANAKPRASYREVVAGLLQVGLLKPSAGEGTKGTKVRKVRKVRGTTTLEERVRLLSTVEFLDPLSDEELRGLAQRNASVSLDPGEILYSPEQGTQAVFLLKEGKMRIYKEAEDGRELTFTMAEPGMLLGEMAFTNHPFQATYAQAVESSTLLRIDRGELEQLIVAKPQVGLRLLQLLSERLSIYQRRMEDIRFKDLPTRLANLILVLAETEGVMTRKGIKIPTHYTHQYLGTMIWANREAVTKAFSKLQDRGAVQLVRRLIYVTDIEVLRQLSATRHAE
jgi:CRP/FNR family transcriptional regulator